MSRNIQNRYTKNIQKLIDFNPTIFDCINPLPLAIGFKDQLLGVEELKPLSRTMLGDLLNVWCSRIEYQKQLRKEGATRYNVDLTISEPVSEEDKNRAARVHDSMRYALKLEKQKVSEMSKKWVGEKAPENKVNKVVDSKTEACKMADTNKAIPPVESKEVKKMTARNKMQDNKTQLVVIKATEAVNESSVMYDKMPTVLNGLAQRETVRELFKARMLYLNDLVMQAVDSDLNLQLGLLMGLDSPFLIIVNNETLKIGMVVHTTGEQIAGFDNIENFFLNYIN